MSVSKSTAQHSAQSSAQPSIDQLEAALRQQAESRVRELRQQTEAAVMRIQADAAERLRLAESRETLLAKAEAERLLRREVQAAETRLAGEALHTQGALVESALAGVRTAWTALLEDTPRYHAVLADWLAAAAQALPSGDLLAEVRPADLPALEPIWAHLCARAAPGRKVRLQTLNTASLGGIRVSLADASVRLDQTFEARMARLAESLAATLSAALFGEGAP